MPTDFLLVTNANPAWSLTLNTSDVIGIIGVIVGLAGLTVAYLQYKKAESAEAAVGAIRQKLFRQQAAQRFSNIAPEVLSLAGQIRIRNWQNCSELGTAIGAKLANAAGFCADLKILASETEVLKLASDAVQFILASIPVEEPDAVGPETVQEMTKRCMSILFGVERISGLLKATDPSEEIR
jgi:hypothetical protein